MPGYLPVGFPIKGLHEGVGYDIQPPGTSPDVLNVRAYDAIKGRLRGGRREGISKYHADAINGIEAIQTIIKMASPTSPIGGSVVAVTDNFDAPVGVTGKANLGPNYVRAALLGGGPAVSVTIDTYYDETNDWVEFPRPQIPGDVQRSFLAVAFYTTNDVTSTIRANGVASTSNSSEGAVDEPTLSGPFIRGADASVSGTSHALTSFIGARMIRVGANQVQLQIFSMNAGTITSLVVSATKTLNGSATATNDCQIRLYENANAITATMDWPTQSIAALTVSIETSFNAGMARAGHITTQAVVAASTVNPWRRLKAFSFSKIVPRDWDSTSGLDGTIANGTDTNRYFLPATWRSVSTNISTNTVTVTTGFQSSASDPGYIAIDDTQDLIWNATTFAASIYLWIEPVAGITPDGVEIDWRAALGPDVSTDGAWIGFKVTDNGENGIFFRFTASGGIIRADTECFNPGSRLKIMVALDQTIDDAAIGGASAGTGGILCLRSDAPLRVVYTPADYVIRAYQNGVLVFQYTLEAAQRTQADLSTGTRTVIGLGANSSGSEGLPGFRFVTNPENQSMSPVDSRLLLVSGGDVVTLIAGVKETPTGGDGAVTEELFGVQGVQIFNDVFLMDGRVPKKYNLTTQLVIPWVATAGTVPNSCRLITRWRARAFCSGDAGDPYNWFAAKSGDPYNFDYGATPSAIKAIAGNNSDVGYVDDIVTALVPYNEDTLILGGDRSISVMEGDPAAGGSIISLTKKIGILFGQAWTRDQANTIYFVAVDGVYRLVRGGLPESLTRGRLDRRFKGIDYGAYRAIMEWDFQRHGLRVFLVPLDSAVDTAIIYFWDSRNDAWWVDELPVTMAPTAVLAYDGNLPDDQTLLLGSRDSRLRQFDDAALGDDGTDITSRVRYAPFVPMDAEGEVDVRLTDLTARLASGSGTMALKVYAGATAEECNAETVPRAYKALVGGRNAALRKRVAGAAVQLELSQTGQSIWAIEKMSAAYGSAGRSRKQG